MNDPINSKKAELESLNQQLDEVKKFQPSAAEANVPKDTARAAIDFASATAVGTLLGYGIDRWQGTLPWGLLIGLVIGTIAGIKMMFQAEAQRQTAETKKTND